MKDQTVEELTPVQERVLISLMVYRFLTVPQLLRLGVAKDVGHLRAALGRLLSIKKVKGKSERKPRLIGELSFGVRTDRGRLPRIYYLTPMGADVLGQRRDDFDEIPYPKRVTKFANEYDHRVSAVDFHISLALWSLDAKQELLWLYHDFDHSNPNTKGARRKATWIGLKQGSIIPDALFMLHDPSEAIDRLCAVEIANGDLVGRVVKQIRRYCDALAEDAINNAYGFEDGVRVLFLFEKVRTMELVRERCLKDPATGGFRDYFFFKPLEELDERFFVENWRRLMPGDIRDPLF